MEGGLGFQVNSIDHTRLTAYLEKGKIPIWDGVAVTTYLLPILLSILSFYASPSLQVFFLFSFSHFFF